MRIFAKVFQELIRLYAVSFLLLHFAKKDAAAIRARAAGTLKN